MHPAGSTLGAIAERVGGVLNGDPRIRLSDATHDSRSAGPEVLFVAVRGSVHDGHDYVEAAVAAGSPAVAVERPMATGAGQLVVEDTRRAMGPMAAEVHNDPSNRVFVVGVTGTNGKTSVTHFIESMIESSGRASGLIGTIETRVRGVTLPSVRTTPEATDFQRLLATMRDLGAEVVAAEVSSHALELGRVASTHFAVAAFTNLSQDHLDFHGTMGSYRAAKERLFREYEVGTAVINIDDPVGAAIADWAPMPVIRIGSQGDVRAESASTSLLGTSYHLVTPAGSRRVESPVVGAFNVENSLIATGCCLALGLGLDDIVDGLGRLAGVPGRFELISGDDPIHVVVDYAHTPGGVHEAIGVARAIGAGRVIAVVGAGGDRDREKRPLMGRAAVEADVAVLTSDNPRSEDPEHILSEVASGVPEGRAILEVDRRRAIEVAVDAARPGDIVLILGKGHETGQEVRGRTLPFDDRIVAREVLEATSRSAKSAGDSGSMAQ
jgi:UDP-N-acetylmuramoyl-L-alanyl-D-glutamate--2,6-diaminopimelate ligase